MAEDDKSHLKSLRSAFQDLLKDYNLEDKYDKALIIDTWSKIVGEPVANRTEKIFVKDRKLFVQLNSAPLRHELSLSKDKIIERLASELGRKIVEDVVFL